jgi:hypothetical protein
MRYLLPEQLRANLSLGRPVEQWLPPRLHDDYVVLRLLRIEKERNSTYATIYIECFDDGNEGFVDVYAFSSVNPDESEVVNNFDLVEGALGFAIENYHASPEKFVGAGMVEEEYKAYLKLR